MPTAFQPSGHFELSAMLVAVRADSSAALPAATG
jgi:hypothetical protein